jgi:hypothetical protein
MPKYDLEWTIERGEETFDILIDYDYRFGTSDSYREPGDPPEVELEKVTFDGKPFELTPEEDEKILLYLCENPPEDDYDDYYPED